MGKRTPPLAHCPPEEVALKSLFLGPQSENGDWLKREVQTLLNHHIKWRKGLFPSDGPAISKSDTKTPEFLSRQKKLQSELRRLMVMLEKETPKFTPRYIGHMVSETAMPALLGQLVMLLQNPNNASREVARVGLRLEREAIAELAQMVGFQKKQARGHFTSGGTVANFEGLWRARFQVDHFLSLGLFLREKKMGRLSLFEAAHMGWPQFRALLTKHGIEEAELRPYSLIANNPWEVGRRISKAFELEFSGPALLVPGNKHYSWQKVTNLMGFGENSFRSVPLDGDGRLDVEQLRSLILDCRKRGQPAFAVVSVAGTTELGEVDPVDQVQDLLDEFKSEGIHLWHHVDAAYGAFFCAAKRSHRLQPNVRAALGAIGRAESVTVDPHKLGYVPYSCGAILTRDEERYSVSSFAAPYLLKGKKADAGWNATLEGSRSASGAAATWLCAKSIGFNRSGYGRILEKGLIARDLFADELGLIPNVHLVTPADTNVLCFNIAKPKETTTQANHRTQQIFEKIQRGPLFAVSKTALGAKDYSALIERHTQLWDGKSDSESLLLIRLVLMNPFIASKQMRVNWTKEFATYLKGLLARQ